MTRLSRIALFVVSGALGFGVDAGILWLVSGALGPYGGRLVSFAVATLVTFAFNRTFTFGDRSGGQSLGRSLLSYGAAVSGGGAINYAVYAALVATLPMMAVNPTLAVALGSLVGAVFNFTMADRLVFSSRPVAVVRD